MFLIEATEVENWDLGSIGNFGHRVCTTCLRRQLCCINNNRKGSEKGGELKVGRSACPEIEEKLSKR